jgi:hypothetical protein
MNNSENIEKLPKWAQKKIQTLEALTKSLEQRVMQIKGEVETNTYMRDGLNKIPIQKNAQIIFYVGEKQQNSVSVYIREDNIIDLNSNSGFGETMVLIPRAANSFYIKFVKS